MSTRILYLLSLCLFTACAVPSTNQTKQTTGPFFDLEGFFEKEVQYLTEQSIKVQKIIHQNDKKEEQQVVIKDWKKELSFFSESDINKPSWKDQYQIDSIYNDNKLLLHYESKDKDLSTQVLDVEIVADTVQSIVIVKTINNQVYSSQQYLTYIPKKHYKIHQTQDIILLSENDYTIEASYLYE